MPSAKLPNQGRFVSRPKRERHKAPENQTLAKESQQLGETVNPKLFKQEMCNPLDIEHVVIANRR